MSASREFPQHDTRMSATHLHVHQSARTSWHDMLVAWERARMRFSARLCCGSSTAACRCRARADLGELARYARSGGSYVSANVGYAPHTAADVLGLLAAFRQGITSDERYVLAATVADIELAHSSDGSQWRSTWRAPGR
jgi:hypothetical protein